MELDVEGAWLPNRNELDTIVQFYEDFYRELQIGDQRLIFIFYTNFESQSITWQQTFIFYIFGKAKPTDLLTQYKNYLLYFLHS